MEQREPDYQELRPIRADDLSPHSPLPGLTEVELISGRTGSRHLWVARAVSAPGLVSPGHHHGPSEAVFLGLRGRLTFFFGVGLRRRVDLGVGDTILIPAWTVHAEGNLGEEDNEVLAIRSTPEPTAFHLPELHVPNDLVDPSLHGAFRSGDE